MATNPWISQNVRSEQNLYEDLVIESLQFYGQDIYYLPREIVNQDKVFLDDVPSRFSDAYKIEMYVENAEGWGGEGDLFSKFGVELRDQATFVVARRRWKKLIGDKLDSYNFRPREGDLLYIPWSKSMFEIFKVETETPFYQLNQLPTFRLQCELFEYNDEDFDTEIDDIDDIEHYNAYEYVLSMRTSEDGLASATATINELGQVNSITIEEAGFGYANPPTITIAENPGNNSKFGQGSLNCILGRGQEGSYTQTNADGSVEMWIYVSTLPQSGQQSLFVTGGNEDSNPQSRYIWGIDPEGKLVYSRYDNNGGGVSTLTGSNLLFTTGQWHHLVIGTYDTDKMYIFFDGEEKLNTTIAGANFDWISSSGYSLGASAARTIDGVIWDGFRGYIDEFRAQVGDYDTLILPRTGGVGVNIEMQTVEYTTDINLDAALYHFNPESATATTTISTDGRIESVEISNGGIYYENPPIITINEPHSSIDYQRGEIVSQTTANYTIKGEVAKWSDSDMNLYLVHVGATDGQYHNFNTYNAVVGEESGASWSPNLVEELQNIQTISQNVTVFDDFEGDLGNFLDFSESNPFGDMQ